jgi:KipI family sensor histidine kinase inhibitor
LLLVEYGEGVDLEVNRKVHAVAARLRRHPPMGLEDVLPSYRSVGVIYDPLLTTLSSLEAAILHIESEPPAHSGVSNPRTVEIPVRYGGDHGPDISFVAEANGLTIEEAITLHAALPYHIYAIGFAPGFCYLGGLHPMLHAPRLESPRAVVPAGSVGIAESQTGVYPMSSPGGWRIIGRTPLRLFAPERPEPFLYDAGDSIRFRAISSEEFEEIARREGA